MVDLPRRIVSLVPSLSETVVFFGLLDRLVGRSDYCVEPADSIAMVESLGGTKNPNVERIIELAPDLLLLNKEENRIEDFRRFRDAGLRIHANHPRSVSGAVDAIMELGEILGVVERAGRLAAACRAALRRCEMARSTAAAPKRVFCPIWRRPWMTFSSRSYVGDVLVQTGYLNVFGLRKGRDFFEVSLEEVRAAGVELLLLPDEPFDFTEDHLRELREAGIDAPAVCFDGKDLSWYGPRIPEALDRLRLLRRGFTNNAG